MLLPTTWQQEEWCFRVDVARDQHTCVADDDCLDGDTNVGHVLSLPDCSTVRRRGRAPAAVQDKAPAATWLRGAPTCCRDTSWSGRSRRARGERGDVEDGLHVTAERNEQFAADGARKGWATLEHGSVQGAAGPSEGTVALKCQRLGLGTHLEEFRNSDSSRSGRTNLSPTMASDVVNEPRRGLYLRAPFAVRGREVALRLDTFFFLYTHSDFDLKTAQFATYFFSLLHHPGNTPGHT